MTSEAIAEFGTGLLHTVVRRTPHGYLWSRSVGPQAPSSFASLSPGLAALLSGQDQMSRARWLIGERDHRGHRHYAASSSLTAAQLLLLGKGVEASLVAALLDALTGVGRLLAELHRTCVPPTLPTPGPSRALRRLHTWLSGESHVPGADLLRTALGPRLFGVLAHGCAGALIPSWDSVLCHGAPGLGSLLLCGPGQPAAMFSGEDICTAPGAYDLGWLVGELIELRGSLGARASDTWQPLIDAVSDGYGNAGIPLDSLWPALRIAVHAHDTIAYRPWSPHHAISQFAPLLHGLLDASALRPSEHLPERTSGAPGNKDAHTPEQDHPAQWTDPAH